MRALLVLVAAMLVVGCLQTGPSKGPATSLAPALDVSWAARALQTDDGGHDHRDWTEHLNLSTPNFIELAHDPLGIPAFGNKSSGGFGCGGAATTSDHRRLTIMSSYDTSVAFVVVDTTDPAHPKHLGDYVLDYAQTYDVDVTPDGKYVVVAADVSRGKQPDPPLASTDAVATHFSFRDACDGRIYDGPDQTVAAGPSTILVSIADPHNPTFQDLVPAPAIGPHSVSTAQFNGIDYIASVTTNVQQHASYYEFFEVQQFATGAKLVLDSTVDAGQYGNVGSPSALANGHLDAEMAMHPVTHKPVVYMSNGGGGVVVLDFSNPKLPLRLGEWADNGVDGGLMHSTRSIEGVHNGRHYVLAGQEFTRHPTNRPSGWMYILDDTDPSHITEVGRWTLPVDTQKNWGGVELFSTHYFRVYNDTAFIAMYHGGVWAVKLDLDHPENMKNPLSVGVFVPDGGAQNGRQPTGQYDYAPFVLDVYPFEGADLVVYDFLSGVYSLHYDEAHPMPAPPPWQVP